MLLNESQLGNPVVRSFLKKRGHSELFANAVNHPSEENKEKLDQAFKQFYTEIRLIKYLSIILHNTAINYDKRNRLQYDRYQLILDQPLKKEEDLSLIDTIKDDNSSQMFTIFSRDADASLEDYVDDPALYSALQRLTTREKEVLKLIFVFELRVTDIAKKMNISHQAVSKTKHRALQKLRDYLTEAHRRKSHV